MASRADVGSGFLTPQQILNRLQEAAGRALSPQEIEQAKSLLPGWENGLNESALGPALNAASQILERERNAPSPGPAPGQPPNTTSTTQAPPLTNGSPGGTPTGTLLDPYNVPPPGPIGYHPPAPPQFQGPTYQQPGQRVAPAPFQYASFDPGAPFQAPDAQAVLNDPGYKFRLGEGEQALQQGAAAQGLLRSGGSMKDLLKYGQNFASNEYGNAYNRAEDQYKTNLGTQFSSWQANRDNALNAYNTNWGVTNTTANANDANSLTGFNANMQSASAAFNPQMQGWQTDVSQGRQNADNFNTTAYNSWLQNYDQWDKQRKFVAQTLLDQQKLGAGMS